jgi:hypothetical protein
LALIGHQVDIVHTPAALLLPYLVAANAMATLMERIAQRTGGLIGQTP